MRTVPIADNIGQKSRTSSTILFWIFQRPYDIPDLDPV